MLSELSENLIGVCHFDLCTKQPADCLDQRIREVVGFADSAMMKEVEAALHLARPSLAPFPPVTNP
jgi:hypothetical protein